MHGSKISDHHTNPQPIPDHDAVVARCLAAAAPDASAEAELAAAGVILGFAHRDGAWTRVCPSCRSTMWLMESDNDGIIAIGIGLKPCSDVPHANAMLRDMGFQNPKRHRAALDAMMRQYAGEGISQHRSDLPDHGLLIYCTLAAIPNKGAGVHYDVWFNIGCAVYSAMPDDDGYEIFRAWSEQSSKYKEKVCREKWYRHNGFRRITRVTVGTLIYHADNCNRGWRKLFRQLLNNEETTS